ncbi:MAG: hypothetical protein Q9176_007455 [Flavoplaca citrina]
MASQGGVSRFGSRVFQIEVGSSGKTLYAHADVLGKSDVLRMIVSGGGKEMDEGKIVWPDWTVGGAERFLEWLYTEDYGFPYPRPLSEAEHGSDVNGDSFDVNDELVAGDPNDELLKINRNEKVHCSPVASDFDTEDEAPARKEVGKEGRTTKEPFDRLQDLTWPGCYTPEEKASEGKKFDNWVGRLLWSPDQLDYEVTFIAHAELYVMACRYMLTELKNLSWQRLRSLLVEINNPCAKSSFMGNLVDLIRYAYKETSNESGCTEPLRQLVTTYAAIHCGQFRGPIVDDLMMSTELSDREFVSGFTLKTMQKIHRLERKNSDLSLALVHSGAEVRSQKEKAIAAELEDVKKKNKDYKKLLRSIGYNV